MNRKVMVTARIEALRKILQSDGLWPPPHHYISISPPLTPQELDTNKKGPDVDRTALRRHGLYKLQLAVEMIECGSLGVAEESVCMASGIALALGLASLNDLESLGAAELIPPRLQPAHNIQLR